MSSGFARAMVTYMNKSMVIPRANLIISAVILPLEVIDTIPTTDNVDRFVYDSTNKRWYRDTVGGAIALVSEPLSVFTSITVTSGTAPSGIEVNTLYFIFDSGTQISALIENFYDGTYVFIDGKLITPQNGQLMAINGPNLLIAFNGIWAALA